MKALMKKGLGIVLVVVCFLMVLAPLTVVQAGEEDIPRIFSIVEPVTFTTPEESYRSFRGYMIRNLLRL